MGGDRGPGEGGRSCTRQTHGSIPPNRPETKSTSCTGGVDYPTGKGTLYFTLKHHFLLRNKTNTKPKNDTPSQRNRTY